MHVKCQAIAILVPEKKIYKILFIIYGRVGRLGHVTWTII